MLKKLTKSLLRISLALAVVLGVPTILYWAWSPGVADAGGKYDHKQNAIWLGHGWLGADQWFFGGSQDPADFRTPEKIAALMDRLQKHHIRFVYPHLCPARPSGAIALYDDNQVARFLDAAEIAEIEVIPWVGGVLGVSALIEEPRWRRNFVASVEELFEKHPRLAGIL